MKKTEVDLLVQYKVESGYEITDWNESNGYILEDYQIRFNKNQLESVVDIANIITEINDTIHSIKEVNEEVRISIFCNAADNLFSPIDIYERIRDQEKYVSNILTKFGIYDYMLICTLYYNTYSINEENKFEASNTLVWNNYNTDDGFLD